MPINWTQTGILVVDSDEPFRDWARQVFEWAKVDRLLVTRDPEEALAALPQLAPHAVIVQMELAIMTSPQFIRKLRDPAVNPLSNRPVVVTANDPKKPTGLLRSCCIAGIDNFLRKPMEADVFLKRVAKTIEAPQRFIATRTYFGPNRRKHMHPNYKGPERRKKAAPGYSLAGESCRPGAGDIPLVEPCTPKTEPEAKIHNARTDDTSGKHPAPAAAGKTVGKGKVEAKAAPAKPKPRGNVPLVDDAPKKKKNSGDDWKDALSKKAEKPVNKTESGIDITALLEQHGQWLQSRGAEGERANLEKADLYGADLNGAMLASANLKGASLADANCEDVNFEAADLRQADLSGALIKSGNLAVANMRHVNLTLANLQGAILRGVDLAGACLKDAELNDADFSGVNLLGTDLRKADLSQVTGLTQKQLLKVIADGDTKLPPGLRAPQVD